MYVDVKGFLKDSGWQRKNQKRLIYFADAGGTLGLKKAGFNVIGAAMALYGRRYILLVREGVELLSNPQGLYGVRYKGDSLDGDATIRLLEAINDIKNNPIPDRYKSNT